MIFCRKCGTQMEDNSRVCPNCQTEVLVEPTPAPQPAAEIVPEQPVKAPKRKKSILKKWWFWLIVVVVIVATIFTIGYFKVEFEQDAFMDYYNKDFKIYAKEIGKMEEHLVELCSAETFSEIEEYLEENDVVDEMQTLMDDVSSYKTKSDEVNEVHSYAVEACEYMPICRTR